MAGVSARLNRLSRIDTHKFVTPPGERTMCQVEPKLFFSTNQYDQKAAKEACGYCPLLAACRLEGLLNPEVGGVWGGMSKQDRKALSARERERQVATLRDVLRRERNLR